MYKMLLITALSLTAVACDRNDKHHQSSHEQNTDKLDKDIFTKTPLDAAETEADRLIIQKIRQAIVADSALSAHAKNIKISVAKGIVILKGSVANAQEKEIIAKKASEVQGIAKVDNQLEIARNNP